MLPVFLNDLRSNTQQDFVEVTLEVDNNSIYLCSVNPTENRDTDVGILGRSLSATSRLRKKFGWLRSGSARTSSTELDDNRAVMMTARDARKIKAKLQRTRSSAQRALKGLRFINRTTTDADEMWKKVESRFESLAVDGLLAREHFGDCIGKSPKLTNVLLIMWNVCKSNLLRH